MKADKFNKLIKPGDHARWMPTGYNDYYHIVICSPAFEKDGKTLVEVKQVIQSAPWTAETKNIILDK